jgi:peroxiredoxin
VAQLRRFTDELAQLDAQVLLVSFGEERWARAWLQETGAPFPLLLDPERAVYRAYGLETSFVRVWSPKVMWHYTRRVLAGQKLQSIQGDPHQLGGDFVVDAQGVIRLAHRSRDPVDRPPVETLLAALT